MPSITIASLNNVDLPVQFSYRPYVPAKRNTTVGTAGAVIVQAPTNQIIHGDGALAWTCKACTPAEFKTLFDLYNTGSPTLYQFDGYWGESLEVLFTSFDAPSVKGRLFDLSGQFQVISVLSSYNPTCV